MNEALSPSLISPISFLLTLASTRMTVRSAATRKSGAVSEPDRDCLAYGDVARDHCSINRRDDIGIAEIDLGGMKRRFKLCDRRLVELHLLLRLLIGSARIVERFPRNGPALRAGLMALEGHFRVGEIRFVLFEPILGCCQIGVALIHNGLIRARVNFSADLPRLNFRVGVAIERLNHAGHASADCRCRRGNDDAACGHGADD